MNKQLTIADQQMLSLINDALNRIHRIATQKRSAVPEKGVAFADILTQIKCWFNNTPQPSQRAMQSQEESCRLIAELCRSAHLLSSVVTKQGVDISDSSVKSAIKTIRSANQPEIHHANL